MYKHILVPVDGSDLSTKSFREGVELAKAIGARVTAVSVVIDSHAPRGAGTAMLGKHVLEDAAEEYLKGVAAIAREAGVAVETFYVVGDSPHEEIIAAAKARGCDLICMGSHGRSLLAGLFLGNEAASVITGCRIPVLIIR